MREGVPLASCFPPPGPASVRAPSSPGPSFFDARPRCPCRYLLDAKRIPYEEVDLSLSPHRRPELVPLADGTVPLPQLLVDGVPVGSAEDVQEFEDFGELDGILAGKGFPAGPTRAEAEAFGLEYREERWRPAKGGWADCATFSPRGSESWESLERFYSDDDDDEGAAKRREARVQGGEGSDGSGRPGSDDGAEGVSDADLESTSGASDSESESESESGSDSDVASSSDEEEDESGSESDASSCSSRSSRSSRSSSSRSSRSSSSRSPSPASHPSRSRSPPARDSVSIASGASAAVAHGTSPASEPRVMAEASETRRVSSAVVATAISAALAGGDAGGAGPSCAEVGDAEVGGTEAALGSSAGGAEASSANSPPVCSRKGGAEAPTLDSEAGSTAASVFVPAKVTRPSTAPVESDAQSRSGATGSVEVTPPCGGAIGSVEATPPSGGATGSVEATPPSGGVSPTSEGAREGLTAMPALSGTDADEAAVSAMVQKALDGALRSASGRAVAPDAAPVGPDRGTPAEAVSPALVEGEAVSPAAVSPELSCDEAQGVDSLEPAATASPADVEGTVRSQSRSPDTLCVPSICEHPITLSPASDVSEAVLERNDEAKADTMVAGGEAVDKEAAGSGRGVAETAGAAGAGGKRSDSASALLRSSPSPSSPPAAKLLPVPGAGVHGEDPLANLEVLDALLAEATVKSSAKKERERRRALECRRSGSLAPGEGVEGASVRKALEEAAEAYGTGKRGVKETTGDSGVGGGLEEPADIGKGDGHQEPEGAKAGSGLASASADANEEAEELAGAEMASIGAETRDGADGRTGWATEAWDRGSWEKDAASPAAERAHKSSAGIGASDAVRRDEAVLDGKSAAVAPVKVVKMADASPAPDEDDRRARNATEPLSQAGPEDDLEDAFAAIEEGLAALDDPVLEEGARASARRAVRGALGATSPEPSDGAAAPSTHRSSSFDALLGAASPDHELPPTLSCDQDSPGPSSDAEPFPHIEDITELDPGDEADDAASEAAVEALVGPDRSSETPSLAFPVASGSSPASPHAPAASSDALPEIDALLALQEREPTPGGGREALALLDPLPAAESAPGPVAAEAARAAAPTRGPSPRAPSPAAEAPAARGEGSAGAGRSVSRDARDARGGSPAVLCRSATPPQSPGPAAACSTPPPAARPRSASHSLGTPPPPPPPVLGTPPPPARAASPAAQARSLGSTDFRGAALRCFSISLSDEEESDEDERQQCGPSPVPSGLQALLERPRGPGPAGASQSAREPASASFSSARRTPRRGRSASARAPRPLEADWVLQEGPEDPVSLSLSSGGKSREETPEEDETAVVRHGDLVGPRGSVTSRESRGSRKSAGSGDGSSYVLVGGGEGSEGA